MAVSEIVYQSKIAAPSEVPLLIKAALRETYNLARRVSKLPTGTGRVRADLFTDANSLPALLRSLRGRTKDKGTRQAIDTAIQAATIARTAVLQRAGSQPTAEEANQQQITADYERWTRTLPRRTK